ncbi:MAG: hypothetical protein RQ968_07185 [Thermoproteota archaeon]|jgi:hypothetical protein|nr:hypothetical protein [Thermoproteota archaeon]
MLTAKFKLIALINIFLITISFLAVNQLQQRVEAFSFPVGDGPKWRNDVVSDLRVIFDSTLNQEHRRHFLRAIGFWNSAGTLVTLRASDTGGYILVQPMSNNRTIECNGRTYVYPDPNSKYIYAAVIEVHPDPACASDRRWWVAVATHELGHALGLGHMKKEPYSIMGGAWDYYRLPIPLLDDILALLYLYGPKKPNPVKFFSTYDGSYASKGPAELNGYPYQLEARPRTYSTYTFASLTSTRITLNDYGNLGAMMIANMKYIMNNLYQGGIGFYISNNPTISSNIVFELTITRFYHPNYPPYLFADFRLSYANSPSNVAVVSFALETFDASNDAAYLVILAVFHWEDGYTYALAVAYKGTDVLGYVNFDRNVRHYQQGAWYNLYLYPSFAVWSDAGSGRTSQYQFDFVYTQYSK